MSQKNHRPDIAEVRTLPFKPGLKLTTVAKQPWMKWGVSPNAATPKAKMLCVSQSASGFQPSYVRLRTGGFPWRGLFPWKKKDLPPTSSNKPERVSLLVAQQKGFFSKLCPQRVSLKRRNCTAKLATGFSSCFWPFATNRTHLGIAKAKLGKTSI